MDNVDKTIANIKDLFETLVKLFHYELEEQGKEIKQLKKDIETLSHYIARQQGNRWKDANGTRK